MTSGRRRWWTYVAAAAQRFGYAIQRGGPLFPLRFAAVPYLHRGHELQLREAHLGDAREWDERWRPGLTGRADGKWDWRLQIARAEWNRSFLCLAAATPDSLEGLISLRVARGESKVLPGSDIVYIEYVGVAPWNQPSPSGDRKIGGVGEVLVSVAGAMAREIGVSGRVGLHSKDEALRFYRKSSWLREIGPDVVDDGTWVYFEGQFRDRNEQ